MPVRRDTSIARIAAWLKRRREQPAARQRHRNDQVGVVQELGAGLREPAAEQPARIVAVAEFEVVDQRAHDAVEAGDGARAIPVGRSGRGGRRYHHLAGAVGQRQPEPVAERRADEVDLAPAGRAQGIVGAEHGVAGEAERRHDEVGDGAGRAPQHPSGSR